MEKYSFKYTVKPVYNDKSVYNNNLYSFGRILMRKM